MVKFNKSINEYDYVLSFDLAKHNTGYSLYSLSDKTVILSGMIIGQEKENLCYKRKTADTKWSVFNNIYFAIFVTSSCYFRYSLR